MDMIDLVNQFFNLPRGAPEHPVAMRSTAPLVTARLQPAHPYTEADRDRVALALAAALYGPGYAPTTLDELHPEERRALRVFASAALDAYFDKERTR